MGRESAHLHVQARLLQEAAQSTGSLGCLIRFCNLPRGPSLQQASPSAGPLSFSRLFEVPSDDGTLRIDRATARVLGKCTKRSPGTAASRMKAGTTNADSPQIDAIAAEETSAVICSSNAATLFETVTLGRLQHRKHYFTCSGFGAGLPPSYDGINTAYEYFVTIEFTVQGTLAALVVPARLLNPFAGLVAISDDQTPTPCLAAAYPFDRCEKMLVAREAGARRRRSASEKNFAAIKAVYDRISQQPVKVNLELESAHIVQINMSRTAFRIGEIVHVLADFAGRGVLCDRCVVAMEQVEGSCGPHQEDADDASFGFRTIAAAERHVRQASQISIEIPIPVGCTPSFKTDAVQCRYRLLFEFHLVSTPDRPNVVAWRLPLTVFSPLEHSCG